MAKAWSVRTGVLLLSSCVAMWGVFACTVEDENPGTAKPRGTDSGADGQGGGGDGRTVMPTAAICGKLGGYESVKGIADGIISAANGDCRLSPMFGQALEDAQHVRYCFQTFLGGSFQCPGVVYSADTKDSEGRDCESVLPHLAFSPKDWALFGDFNAQPACIARAVFEMKGLSIDELRSVASVFEAVRAPLANPDAIADKYTQCAPGCALGGDACPIPIVDPDAGDDAADAAAE